MEDFKLTVIGTMPTGVFLGYLFIACFVALFAMGIRADKARKTTTDTPDHFDLGFFFRDNILSLLVQLAGIVLAIRFCNMYMGQEATSWLAAVIGYGSNKAAQWAQMFQDKARDTK